jgi:hypothetical protein
MTVRMKKNAKVTEDVFSGDIVRHVVHKNMVRSILFLLFIPALSFSQTEKKISGRIINVFKDTLIIQMI